MIGFYSSHMVDSDEPKIRRTFRDNYDRLVKLKNKYDPDNLLQHVTRLGEYTGFTMLANALGLPAMSVPLHWTDSGLPVGVHFMGRYADEATLFRLAGQLEQAQPWANRYPPINALQS